MSFVGYKKNIEEGDTVILFLGYDNMLQFTVVKHKTHQTRYGALRHNDLIGVKYGSKVQCSKGYAHVLHPTSELWTQNLPHRTQILYTTDISFITLMLDLKPGCVVVESGTGSASLSHALLRSINPGGYLHTFDFHEQRVEKAREEFRDHGFVNCVTVTHRDVLADGFDLKDVADAVFLDLPAPWEAIPHAKKALKQTGGRLCSFSPCIEQVQRACETLSSSGFSEIQTYECLSRTFDVRTSNMPMPDMGFAWTTTADMKLSAAKEDRGGSAHHPVIGQIEICETKEYGKKQRGKGQKRSKKGHHDKLSTSKDDQSDHQVKDNKSLPDQPDNEPEPDVNDDGPESKIPKTDEQDSKPSKSYFDKSTSYLFKSGVVPNQMPGHTGYLTFATLYPE